MISLIFQVLDLIFCGYVMFADFKFTGFFKFIEIKSFAIILLSLGFVLTIYKILTSLIQANKFKLILNMLLLAFFIAFIIIGILF